MSEPTASTDGTREQLHDVEIESASSVIEQIVDGVVNRALSHADSTMVYAQPVKEGDRTVIPVARVSTRYGFGGGAGHGTGHHEDDTGSGSGGGGGGGGAVDAKPVGYIEVTPGETRFVAIIDESAVALRAVTLVGIGIILIALGFMRSRGSNG